jgi:hypothetical protein
MQLQLELVVRDEYSLGPNTDYGAGEASVTVIDGRSSPVPFSELLL